MKIQTKNPIRQTFLNVLTFFRNSLNGLNHSIHQNMKSQSESYTMRSANPLCIKTTSVHKLVSKLQRALLYQTTNKKNVIVNDADKTLAVFADENILAFVIGSLLSNAVENSSNCCIRLGTFFKENIICIRIRNNGAYIYNSQMNILGHIGEAVRKLNGSISYQTGENRPLTVTLSMPFIHVR
jgi:light-regulated signal transduction histidine kinase (bacteriophytochrome)